jgi:hypothetical protein
MPPVPLPPERLKAVAGRSVRLMELQTVARPVWARCPKPPVRPGLEEVEALEPVLEEMAL